MKKVLKVLGYAIGAYTLADMSLWAIHGAACWFRELEENNRIDSVGKSVFNMIRDDLKTIKNDWNNEFYCKRWL